jgi:hypothetical protein
MKIIKLAPVALALALLALSGCGSAPEGLPDGPIKYLTPCSSGLPDGPIAYFGPDMEPVAQEDAAIACDQAGTCCALEQ